MRNRPLRLDELLAESPWVRRVAYDLLGNSHEAEDVAQEVLVAAYRQQPTTSGTDLRPWLRTVTQRKAARKKQVHQNRAIAERQAAREEASEASVADRVALHTLLARAVNGLPPLLGEAVVLRYFDGLTPRQIAKQLGITGEAARQRVSRGLKLLRLRLDLDADPDDPQRGRELWSTALVGTLGPPKSAALIAFSPLLFMTLKAKILLAAIACAAALLLVWRTGSVATTGPGGRGAPSGGNKVLDRVAAAPAGAAHDSDDSREAISTLARGAAHPIRSR